MATATVTTPTPAARSTDSRRAAGILVDLAIIAACAGIAALLEQDANWDQLQYHYWYPWQLFNGGFSDPDLYGGRFQNPLPQVPFFLVASTLSPVVAQAVLGATAGISVVLVRRIGMRVLPFAGGWQLAAATTAAILAAVGAGFRSELGTSYADILLTALLLGGLLLILRGQVLAAGLLAGAAVGLKYTSAPFAVAALVALLVLRGTRLRRTVVWLAGAALGWLALGAWWAWNLQRTYDSPVFPFWNSIFGSPWFPTTNLTDERYGVQGMQQWLRWPLDMATGSARVLDLPVKDPRWLLLAAAVVAIVLAARRVSRPGLAVLAFTLTGLVTWLAVFGVIRYAIPAEMLAGLLIVWAISLYASARATVAVGLALAVAAGLLTQSAAGRRVPFGDQWYEVAPGGFSAVQTGDVVLVDGQYPSTFLLAGNLPDDVSVHVVQKDFTGTALQDWLSRDLAGASRVWVLTDTPQSQVDGVVGTIDYDSCVKVQSNVVNRRLCPVTP